jgi:hypothetical protein
VSKDFWVGEINSIESEYQGGEVRVRVYGYQDNTAAIPDDALRWARVMFPTTHAQLQGAGGTHGMLKGTKVIGIWLDEERQVPLILGTVGASGDVPEANTAATQIGEKTSA